VDKFSYHKARLPHAVGMGVVNQVQNHPFFLLYDINAYSSIRVAIADDHAELRLALRLLLNIHKDIEIVCETSNGQEAVDCVKHLQPDVLVMDIQMPVLDGFRATRQITDLSVSTRVILMSTYRGHIIAREASAAGARGFVPKDHIAEWLHTAIETVHQGDVFFIE
jgi:DNA-binding NarL/FixJ family response regulator